MFTNEMKAFFIIGFVDGKKIQQQKKLKCEKIECYYILCCELKRTQKEP